jgi:hypothetical protein
VVGGGTDDSEAFNRCCCSSNRCLFCSRLILSSSDIKDDLNKNPCAFELALSLEVFATDIVISGCLKELLMARKYTY